MISLRKIKATLFICVLIAGGMTSCKKDKDVVVDPAPDKGDCKLTEMSYGSGALGMKTTVTYNSQKQLTENTTLYMGMTVGAKYTYNSKNQVILREEFEGANKEVNWKVEYSYTNDRVDESKSYYYDNGTWTLAGTNKHEYVNNKLVKVRRFMLFGTDEKETAYSVYGYDGNGNVNSIVGYTLTAADEWIETSRRNLVYVSKTAQWSLLTLLTDDPNFPATQLILSDRSEELNEDSGNWETTDDLAYTYTYNDKGLPVTIEEAGAGTGTLLYSCN
jgi:hypothetical protein